MTFVNSIAQNIDWLHRAAVELVRGFETLKECPRDQQAASLRECSAVLIEMRRLCDELANRCG
jgi:hypothetical protein